MANGQDVATKCPHCHASMDKVAHPHDRPFRVGPGDVNFCIYCRELSEFDEDMNLVIKDGLWEKIGPEQREIVKQSREFFKNQPLKGAN